MLFATSTTALAAAALLSSIAPTLGQAAWPGSGSGSTTGGTKDSKQKKQPSDAVLLSQVETLTLRGHGALTSHRRVSAIPQLRCVSHPQLCRLADDSLDVMRCTNQGSSYGDADVEWSCAAVLPDELRLGSTDVICEGYASPDDPYVLKGSCGVEYRVALTAKGEERYPDLMSSPLTSPDMSGRIFMVVFIGVFLWIVYSAWSNWNANNARQPRRQGTRRRNPGGRGGGGGGGGDDYGSGGGGGGGGWDPRYGGFQDDSDDPPPPYPGRKSQAGSSSQRRQQQQEGWRPGFWSGLAAGGAAAYYAGSGRNRDRDDNNGGGGGLWGARRRTGGPSSSSSQAGPSGSSYESTGFGSTSRR